MITTKHVIPALEYPTSKLNPKRADVPLRPPYACDYCGSRILSEHVITLVNKFYMACYRCAKDIKDTSELKGQSSRS